MSDPIRDKNEELAEQLHKWYLEAVKNLDPQFYNGEAEKEYEYLNEQQKEIDRYIARKIILTSEKRIAELELALQGRTVSCEACNGMAKEIESLKETIEVLSEKTGVRVLKQEISDLTEAVRVMAEALEKIIIDYTHSGLIAKKTLANPAVMKVVGK